MIHPITRRRFLGTAGRAATAAAAAGCGLVLRGCSKGKDLDIVIFGGLVYDGLGGAGRKADLGISGGLIREVGTISPGRGKVVIEARNRAVAPGFIDVHDHTDIQLLVEPQAPSAIRQGVTTLISGQCGSSPAPIAAEVLEESAKLLREEYGVELTWRDLPGFFARLEEKGIGINYATLVGHGSVRGAAMGLANRLPTPEELEKMSGLVESAMRGGALGLSSGLEYTPGSFAAPDEIAALCRVVAKFGGVYATHMRDEGERLIESLDESIQAARSSGARLQISHFKTAYPKNWAKIDAALAKIEEAKAAGVDISCDRYPYIAAATSLSFNFPIWAREGTTDALIARLQDPARQAELRAYIDEREKELGSWDKVVISSVLTEKNRVHEGRNILEGAEAEGKTPYAFMRDLVVEERDNVGMVIFIMTEDNLRRILAHPLVGIGSDGSMRSPSGVLGKGKPHPRVYGAFARALGKYVREEKILSWEEMIMKVTSRPAAKFGLEGRGAIRPEYAADVVVFDPERIADRATWKEPHQFPDGVGDVIVNGVAVVAEGAPTGRLPGAILRKRIPA